MKFWSVLPLLPMPALTTWLQATRQSRNVASGVQIFSTGQAFLVLNVTPEGTMGECRGVGESADCTDIDFSGTIAIYSAWDAFLALKTHGRDRSEGLLSSERRMCFLAAMGGGQVGM